MLRAVDIFAHLIGSIVVGGLAAYAVVTALILLLDL